MSNTNSIFRVALERQTYKNMLYLLLSLPFGAFYFFVLVTGIALGVGTLIIWIGVPILFVLMTAWWRVAAFERFMAMYWLQVPIAPLSLPSPVPITRWQRWQMRLWNPMTWKIFLYLLLKFHISLIPFVLTLVLPLLSIAITLVALAIWLISSPFVALVASFKKDAQVGKWLQGYFKAAIVGFGLTLITFYLLNGIALFMAKWSRLMLGMSQTRQRLEEANMLAVQEKARAEQADQRRKQLVVNLSHELRAPVASIAGHLESLLILSEEGNVAPAPATLHRYLGIAHQEAKRLSMLVDELLSLARMESDELRLNIREVAARDVIEEVYQLLSPLALNERRVMLVRGAVPDLSPVLVDRQRLVQILVNLVRNAITSTPAGGIVEINLEPAQVTGYLALIVADSGVGIPPEELEHIFERFYRTGASHIRTTGGFGLGLAIVHDLVTAMGGSISVESSAGQGSRFCVLLRTGNSR
jgi:signal transduction histidine kinase